MTISSRQVKLLGRRIGGTWGKPQKENRGDANRGSRNAVNHDGHRDQLGRDSDEQR
jgi:hypothetical protein